MRDAVAVVSVFLECADACMHERFREYFGNEVLFAVQGARNDEGLIEAR